MPELWELCDTESLAILIQLHWQQFGTYPDFWYEMQESKPIVTMSPDVEEDTLEETKIFMAKPPSHQRRVT
uniref:Uncharacterized protein n=1 Tax=viral metagenome TaxID=1070528 RepID=A0A6M3J586_9ZZZZ